MESFHHERRQDAKCSLLVYLDLQRPEYLVSGRVVAPSISAFYVSSGDPLHGCNWLAASGASERWSGRTSCAKAVITVSAGRTRRIGIRYTELPGPEGEVFPGKLFPDTSRHGCTNNFLMWIPFRVFMLKIQATQAFAYYLPQSQQPSKQAIHSLKLAWKLRMVQNKGEKRQLSYKVKDME